MTPQPLPLSAETRTERMASFLRGHRGQWVDALTLSSVGGVGAWRTEISRCRHDLHMDIRNRVTRDTHGRVLCSEYRLVGEEGREERSVA
jgi:hypothetical protein